jgi:hypothetical protein
VGDMGSPMGILRSFRSRRSRSESIPPRSFDSPAVAKAARHARLNSGRTGAGRPAIGPGGPPVTRSSSDSANRQRWRTWLLSAASRQGHQ